MSQNHMSHAPHTSTDALKHNHSIVVFVNIDWTASRHNTVASDRRNMKRLKTTVRSIIRTHEPVVICFCEVGDSSNPLTLYQMSIVSQAIEDTWHELLQSTQLQRSFEQGYPYLTVWDSSRVHCFNFHITECYEPQPFRTAQLFGMQAATLEVDIVNVHLASGKEKLTDPARKGSLENILRRKSSLHDGTIGQSRSFILGGDMNTSKERMSVIFSALKRKRLLQSNAMPNFIVPSHGKHGDLAVAMDQDVSLACGKAINHDPKHVPVALKLLHSDPPLDQGKAQCLRFCPQTTHPIQKEELEHVRTGHLRPAQYNNSVSSCAASEIAEDVRPQDSPTSPCTATEHAESIMITPDVHAQDDCDPPCNAKNHAKALTMISKPLNQATGIPNLSTIILHPPALDNGPDSPCTATEHAEAQQDNEEHAEAHQDNESASPCPNNESIDDVEPYTHNDHDGQFSEYSWITDDEFMWQDNDKNANHLGPEAEKLYCSISLLMWNANLDNLEVEKIIHDCIQERVTSSNDVIQSMEEICYPFFFAERTDNTKWKPHDLYQIIQNLLWYDWFRQGVLHKYDLPATTMLTTAQCADCWKDYLIWFDENELRANQRSANITSYMAARMHRDVGNRFAVYSTWKFGLPTMGEPLRQACLQAAMLQSALSWQYMQALVQHVHLCIRWCQLVAEDIRQRKTTDKYIEEKRKSGSWKQTGLNDTELAARQHKQQQQQQQQQRQRRWRR